MRFLPLGLDQKQVLIVNGLTGAPQVRPVLRDGCHMALRSTADGLGRAIFLGVLSMDPLMGRLTRGRKPFARAVQRPLPGPSNVSHFASLDNAEFHPLMSLAEGRAPVPLQ